MTIIAGPFYLFVHQLSLWRGCDFGPHLPTFPRVVFELIAFVCIEEIFFYYGHRLMHTPLLYKRIHKIHHEWTAPIGACVRWRAHLCAGLVSLYAHPFEHVVCNLVPPLLGPLLTGSHVATALLWYTLALLSTTSAHSGYHFPVLPSPEAHDYHHFQ